MRRILATAAAFAALGLTSQLARPADLGTPATLDQIMAMGGPASTLTRCFVEGAAVGTFLVAGDRQAHGSIGVGCDMAVSAVSIGASIRADLGDSRHLGLAARLGYAINPHVTAYGLAEWRIPDFEIANAGSLHLGAGLESAVSNLVRGLSVFGEASVAAAKFGSAATRDDVSTRAGLRYRF